MINWFGYFKALHLIFMVSWFAGLFYMVRLFVIMQSLILIMVLIQKLLKPIFINAKETLENYFMACYDINISFWFFNALFTAFLFNSSLHAFKIGFYIDASFLSPIMSLYLSKAKERHINLYFFSVAFME